MLAIIPKEVLAALPEIHKLLDLGKNYSVKKNKKKNPREGKGEIELPINTT